MKGILRSKLVLTLAAFLMIAAAIAIPLSGNILHSHAASPAATSVTNTFTVNANQDLPGLDTGIDLTVGNGITFKASGQAQFSPDFTQDCSTTEKTNPDGQRILLDGTLCPGKFDSSAVLPGSPVGTLIAQIGSSGWFAVGSSDGFTSTKSGRLFLLYNDNPGEYDNNSGSYQVTVTITTSTPTPTPSPTPPSTSKNLVILLQGINSKFPDTDPNLAKVGLTLKGLPSFSPSTTQFVNYSYAGSDPKTGAPLPYMCVSTFTNTILRDILRLNDQIKRSAAHFGSTNIYLVGHSLGGVIAFGYMALLEEHSNGVSLPAGTKLKAVVTLDSPLGGVPGTIYTAFSKIVATQPLGIPGYPCAGLNLLSSFLTFDDLVRITNSPNNSGGTTPPGDAGKDPQGAVASIFAITGVSNPLPKLPFLPSNDFIAGLARTDLGTAILSIGNVHDYLWEPNALSCQAAVFAISPELAILASFIPDFRSTQFLEDQGNNSGHYGRSLNSNNSCIVASINTFNHLDVLSAADVQTGLMHFFANLGHTPTPLQVNPFQA